LPSNESIESALELQDKASEPEIAGDVCVIASLLIGVALMAAHVPARRAAKVAPMASLRRE
jgi:hypothetical protein